jgi:signal transduction histidine kinase/CheY-like chemotaxis protein
MTGLADAFWDFLSTQGFQPHGLCLLWRADVFWTHVVADLLIAASYFSIPAAIFVFSTRRRDFPHRWVLHLFIAFIVWCGITHLFGIWTLWVPDYGIQAIAKAITAVVSFGTALAVWPLVPKLLAIPSQGQLTEANRRLIEQVEETQRTKQQISRLNMELEQRVSERTAELEATNRLLQEEIERRVEIEAAVRASRAQAEDADAAKTQFLTMISHELRTPLTTVLGYAQLLDRQAANDDNPKHRKYVKNILAGGHFLVQLVDDLLDLTRIQAGKIALNPEPLNVRSLLEQIESSGRVLASTRELALTVDLDSAAGAWLRADRVRVEQVLLNLLTNAVKYNKENGTITVRVRSVTDAQVCIEVSDTGAGIPADKLSRLFKPFDRMGRENGEIEGTGIGLSIAKSLVELMDGMIACDSREGAGTTFLVHLPRVLDTHTAVELPTQRTSRMISDATRVLYIEDNRANQELMRDIIEGSGAGALQIAETGEKGLEIAIADPPDIIFVDVNLPGMNGMTVLQRLRLSRFTRNVRIVAVSAAATRSDVQLGLASGFDAYLTKPIEIGRVLDEIAKATPGARAA